MSIQTLTPSIRAEKQLKYRTGTDPPVENAMIPTGKGETMTIICRRYDLSTHHTETIEPSQVASYLKQEQTLLWIETKLPSDGELAWLGQTFSLHPATVKLVQMKDGDPSFDWQEEYYVFTSTAVHFDEQHLLHDPVYIIFSQQYILTVEYQPIGFLAGVRRQWESHEALEHAAPYFNFLILDSIADSYLEVAHGIRSKIDELSNTSGEPGQTNVPQKVQGLMDYLNKIDHLIFDSIHSIYALLHKVEGHSLYPITALQTDFLLLEKHYKWIDDQIRSDKEILTSLLNQFQTHQTDYLNTLVNRLTVVTIILSTAAVITGFYGMNVGGIFPNSNNPKGALLVLALIVLLAVIQFLLLRPLWRRKS
jgi:Mg2+ and Co2+ transporter CorA